MEVKDAPVQLRLDHKNSEYRTVSGFFNVPYYLISNKGYETGPPVYSPYPRRLESLTVCRCSYKVQRQHILLSYFKTRSVGPAGVELTTSRMTAQCSTNCATGARAPLTEVFDNYHLNYHQLELFFFSFLASPFKVTMRYHLSFLKCFVSFQENS